MVFSKPGAATATFMKLRLFIFESRGIRPMLAAVFGLNPRPVYRFARGCQTGSTRPFKCLNLADPV